MGLFGINKKKLAQELNQFETNLKYSFSKVKEEMNSVTSWMNYYYQRSLYFEDWIKELNNQAISNNNTLSDVAHLADKNAQVLTHMASKLQLIAHEVEALSSLEPDSQSNDELNFHIEKIYNELERIEKRVEHHSYLSSTVQTLKEQLAKNAAKLHEFSSVEKRVDKIQEKLNQFILKKTPKEKLVQKVTKNRPDYLLAMVLSYIKKYEKISAYQLREMMVEEQNLTSKSSFYRILEKIEQMEDISVIWEGKEKVYLTKAKKSH